MHSGKVLQSAQGPVKFNKLGENFDVTAFTFQWQGTKFVEVNPTSDSAAVKILFPKPVWSS